MVSRDAPVIHPLPRPLPRVLIAPLAALEDDGRARLIQRDAHVRVRVARI